LSIFDPTPITAVSRALPLLLGTAQRYRLKISICSLIYPPYPYFQTIRTIPTNKNTQKAILAAAIRYKSHRQRYTSANASTCIKDSISSIISSSSCPGPARCALSISRSISGDSFFIIQHAFPLSGVFPATLGGHCLEGSPIQDTPIIFSGFPP